MTSMATAEDESQRLLGGFIRAQRQMANLSLRQLSVLAKVSNPYLSQVERGLHEPSVRVLRSIADALNLSAGTLFEQAGLISDTEGSSHSVTEHAIGSDRRLTDFQRRAMLGVYRSYVQDNSSKPDHPTVGQCPPSLADRMGDSTS
jgi:transcriptional regulator with XRE-family HTH domain